MLEEQKTTTPRESPESEVPATGSAVERAWRASRAAAHGDLPARYQDWWHPEYYARVRRSFRPGMSILDVGAGCHPTLALEERPPGCHYVGLDLSPGELEKAPPGGYDDAVAADATKHVAALNESFDLVLSYLVLEHVADLPQTFDNIRSYLRPGGRFIAYFSGTFSVFGLANRVLPSSVSSFLLEKLLHRERESVFPAFYHRCWSSAIRTSMCEWSSAEIQPMWFGAGYFEFSRLLKAAYIGYEEWARLESYDDVAPYYLVDAVR